MPNYNKGLLEEVAGYYSSRLAEHGNTPQGVDWNGEESQTLRFAQLCKIIESPGHFSVNDLGCGYGALHDYLSRRYQAFSYVGIDISEDMIKAAETRLKDSPEVTFTCSSEPQKPADYSIASGIFNVRLGRSDSEWLAYLEETLDTMARTSHSGFAFNCLTSYSDRDKMRDYLYYADPCRIFDLCKRRYSRQVALLHDYRLYEFTIMVRKIP